MKKSFFLFSICKQTQVEKRKRDEEEIISYLKKGYRQVDILNQKKELTPATLSLMITKLKEEKRITKEEIEESQVKDEDIIELEKLVLNGMKKGFTVKQIIDSDEMRICYRK